MTDVLKKVRMQLVGIDGNAFSILGAFASAARKQGWTPVEIAAVRDEATSGNYDHLLATIVSHVEEIDEEDETDEEEDEE